jgi:hypothetical protein
MNPVFASVIGEAWDSLAERRFLFLTLIGFVCAFPFTSAGWRAITAIRLRDATHFPQARRGRRTRDHGCGSGAGFGPVQSRLGRAR